MRAQRRCGKRRDQASGRGARAFSRVARDACRGGAAMSAGQAPRLNGRAPTCGQSESFFAAGFGFGFVSALGFASDFFSSFFGVAASFSAFSAFL